MTISSDSSAAPFSGLRYVSLRLLWDCNLRCVMCDHPHRARSEMSPRTAHQVLDQLPHPVRLTFIGGEPCLWLKRHPDVLRRALADGHVVHLITNGALIGHLPDFVAAFRDRAVSVQISIDGYEEVYERIRKRGRWSDVVAAIRLLHGARREGGNPDAVLTVSYLLMRSTLPCLPDFLRFCAREGVDAVSLTYAIVYDSMVARGEITEDASVHHCREATDAAVAEARRVAAELGLSLSYPPPLGDPAAAFGRRWLGPQRATLAPGKSPLPAGVACSKPWKEIFVNQDGTIVPCCCGPGVGPVIGRLDDGLETLWNGGRVQEVRRTLADGRFAADCRCGANVTEVGRRADAAFFFTRLEKDRK